MMGVKIDGMTYSTAQLEVINDRARKEIREHYNTHHRPQEPTTMELFDEHTPEWEPDLITKCSVGQRADSYKLTNYRWTCKCGSKSSRAGLWYDNHDESFRAFLAHKYNTEWYEPPHRLKTIVDSLTFKAISAILVINGFAALVYWIVTWFVH
jgi:hypothetical protein